MYMPSCFSRPICHFAMSFKDEDDLERQDLLPYVMRLACADTDEIERERQIYIEGRKCRPMSFAIGIAILQGALAIGRQADLLSLAEVQARMSATNQPRWSALAVFYFDALARRIFRRSELLRQNEAASGSQWGTTVSRPTLWIISGNNGRTRYRTAAGAQG